ncbi:hypothetical protein TrRE_jg8942 [Triparma retinervis]|uniref:Sm domain-containing protein n=1 Tax=Triparma retinervis TaxID=2557542 RepID=A0A9W7A0X3_9STRA|nr:hypothetical protein TrRE_jg8942 [Triparma retinervis]
MSVPFGSVPGYLPGSTSLVEQLDRPVLLVLRDSRHIIGVLRSFDQFCNVLVEQSKERRFCWTAGGGGGPVYADVEEGSTIIKGDQIVVMGEVDDLDMPEMGGKLRKVTIKEFNAIMEKVDEEEERKRGKCWDFDTDLNN